ncbi:lipase family protein [Mesoterricola sediminis]|uniref:Secretory lipase n=1 Tax=Mesoterricola sediminis TaxID=2927980 RepID=A0AA48KF26_9BACT|nr:lipase family protein [Mesoterricola sediminis]BDU77887.1 hypothetical protein METESE_28450 [Mesoterricola sediminis]
MNVIRRCLAPAVLFAALALAPLRAQDPPTLLPTGSGDPLWWDTFISCVDALERFTGPRLPEWVVRTAPLSYRSRRPLYDREGHPLPDGAGGQATEPCHQSGRYFLPPAWRVGRGAALPLVIYNHATTLAKDQVPSTFQGHEWIFGAAAAAYYGFAVVMPDQPGMGGDAVATHPYLHARSLGHAVVDAIGAARDALATDPYARTHGYAWDGRVFLIGYSEGGFASLAAAKELEARKAEFGGEADFLLAGTACLAAPVDLPGAVRRMVLEPSRPFSHPFFLPYLVIAWHEVYGPVMDPLEVLAPRLLESRTDGNILQWMDGTRGGDAADMRIAQRMGAAPCQVVLRTLLSPAWVARNLEEPGYATSPFRAVLEENDVSGGWAPTRPLFFGQSLDDQEVPPAIAQRALDRFSEAIRAEGRDPDRLLSFKAVAAEGSGVDHVKGTILALPAAFDWIHRGGPPVGRPPTARR